MPSSMYFIDIGTTDPALNLATEEYLFSRKKEGFFLVYTNRTSVIIGKHQAAHREADTHFIVTHGIPLIRRFTGGGAVYHDEGNINFTFISNSEEGKQVDFEKYTGPVTAFLSEAGIDAKLEGKSDIRVNGLKISGNAEHVFRNRVMHHGTLLFNASLGNMKAALRADTSAYLTRAVPSRPSPVINLIQLTNKFNGTDHLKHKMAGFIRKITGISEEYVFTEPDKKEILRLASEKYSAWSWNYAYGPEYDFAREFLFEDQKISCRFHVRDGIIMDFILKGNGRLERLSGIFDGCRHMPVEMEKRHGSMNDIFPDIYNFF